MKLTSIAVFAALFGITVSVQAQSPSQSMSPSTEIRESTDPARIAEVERRAAELMSRGQTSPSMDATSGSSGTSSGEQRMKSRRHGAHGGMGRSGDTGGGAGAGSGSR